MAYLCDALKIKYREELEEKYGDILNDWSEELRIERDEEMIYYTKEQKQKLFINLEEQGYTKEELTEAFKFYKIHNISINERREFSCKEIIRVHYFFYIIFFPHIWFPSIPIY